MSYIITLKTPQMQVYVRAPLVGGEWTKEEWDKREIPALEPRRDLDEMNDQAFRDTLLERPFLVCRKFTTGRRVIVFLDNVGMIEEIPDEQAHKMLEEIQKNIRAAIEREQKGEDNKRPVEGGDGRKITTPPFAGPGFRIPRGRRY